MAYVVLCRKTRIMILATGINASHINSVCHENTNRKTAGGFVWKFEERDIDSKELGT